jgi:hypothetical protein
VAVIDNAVAWQVAAILNSNRTLSSDEMVEYDAWRNEIRERTRTQVSEYLTLLSKTEIPITRISHLLSAVLDGFECNPYSRTVCFNFEPSYLPKAGDRLSCCSPAPAYLLSDPVLEEQRGNTWVLRASVAVFDSYSYTFQVIEGCKLEVSRETYVERGGAVWLAPEKDEPLVSYPFLVSTRVQRLVKQALFDESPLDTLEHGQLLDNAGLCLWYDSRGKPYVERLVDNEEGIFPGVELFQKRGRTHEVAPAGAGTEEMFTFGNNSLLPLRWTVQQKTARDTHSPYETEQLCDALDAAEWPIFLKQWGDTTRYAELGSFKTRTVIGIENTTLSVDPVALQSFGCIPVLLVTSSLESPEIRANIEAMLARGWRVVVWQNGANWQDRFLASASSVIAKSAYREKIIIVKGGEQEVLDTLTDLAEEGLRLEPQQRQRARRENYPHDTIIHTGMPSLLELSDRSLTQGSATRLKLSTELIQLTSKFAECPEDAGPLIARAQDWLGNEQGSYRVQGRTQLEHPLSWRDFAAFAEKLSLSHLPFDHPAVALRGVTSEDLSAQWLYELYLDGANFYSVRDDRGSLDGLAITFPPAVLERRRPGLSTQLGAPGKTGYAYWIWVNPEDSSESRSVYLKLMSAFLLEQCVCQAHLAAAAVLERNLPSLRTVFAVAGFKLLPGQLRLAGEPAIRVGYELTSLRSEQPVLSVSEAMKAAEDIFCTGTSENIAEATRRFRQTLTFTEKLIELHTAWIQVGGVIAHTNRFAPLDAAVRRVEDALQALSPGITPRQLSDAKQYLLEVLHERTRDDALVSFSDLLGKIAPESLSELKRFEKRIRNSHMIPDSMDGEQVRGEPRFEFDPTAYPHESVGTPLPQVDLSEVVARHETLSEEFLLGLAYTRNVSSFWAEYSSDDPERYRDMRNHLREVYRRNARVFNIDLRDTIESQALPPLDLQHARELQAFIDYAHAHIGADTYDREVARTVMAAVHAYVYFSVETKL